MSEGQAWRHPRDGTCVNQEVTPISIVMQSLPTKDRLGPAPSGPSTGNTERQLFGAVSRRETN
jgi:hypothetical protein